jgi:hypothetical protein
MAALEEKIVQHGVVTILHEIYEEGYVGLLVWISGRGVACIQRWMR